MAHAHYLLTYFLLTPLSEALLENLTGLQLVNKFPAFYGTRKFIAAKITIYIYIYSHTQLYILLDYISL